MDESVPSEEDWPAIFRVRRDERRLSKTVVAQEQLMYWVLDESQFKI